MEAKPCRDTRRGGEGIVPLGSSLEAVFSELTREEDEKDGKEESAA